MSDAVIRADAIQAAPAGYTVPGAQEILVKSVRAVVDGSGAGTAFLPTLQLIDPSGNVVWQSPTDTGVAAGGSADVSWFPRVGSAAAAAATSGQAIVQGEISSGVTQTVLAGATRSIVWNDVQHDASGTFTWNGSSGIFIHQTGSFWAGVQLLPDIDWPAAAAGFINFGFSLTDGRSIMSSAIFAQHPAVDIFDAPAAGPQTAISWGIFSSEGAGLPFELLFNVHNTTAANFVYDGSPGTQFCIYRIGDELPLA